MNYIILILISILNSLSAQVLSFADKEIFHSLLETAIFFSTEEFLNQEMSFVEVRDFDFCDVDMNIASGLLSQIEIELHTIDKAVKNVKSLHADITKRFFGFLRDNESRVPLIFASLAIFNHGKMIGLFETDLDGRFSFQLSDGDYELQASYVGYDTKLRLIKVGEQLKETFESESIAPFQKRQTVPSCSELNVPQLKKDDKLIKVDCFYSPKNKPVVFENNRSSGFLISGKISDSTSSAEMPYANVVLLQDDVVIDHATSGFHGNYEFINVKPGIYDLKISYVGYETHTEFIKVDENLLLDVALNFGTMLKEVVVIGLKPPTVQDVWRGCGTFVSTEIMDSSLDIESFENRNSNLVSFYPNPAINQTTIQVKEKAELLLITTSNGRIMYKEQNLVQGEKTVFLQDYISGTYFISLITCGMVQTEPLVVVK